MKSFANALSSLNAQQKEAALHKDGPMLVVAGPGSGKTNTLTVRAAELFESEVCAPDELTAVTFTNKAAAEMRGRLHALVGAAASGAHLRTFHSLCLWILRRYVGRLDGWDSRFVVYDESDSMRMLRQINKEWKVDKPLEEIAATIDAWKARGRRSDDAPDTVEGRFYAEYQRRLQGSNAMDFGDLMLHALYLLQTDEHVLSACRSHAKYLMVDEYQDTNPVQYELVLALGRYGPNNVFVVGDPDQSIYAFRGADVSNILRFTQDFPECRTVLLERNYRSSKTILRAANSLIRHNEDRIERELWTDREHDEPVLLVPAQSKFDELDRVAELVRSEIEQGAQPRDIAVISRTRRYLSLAEETLHRHRIPVEVVGAVGYYERKEIRDVLAYLRLLWNPRDDAALLRIINVPTRGIGAKTVEVIRKCRQPHECLLEAAERAGREGIIGARSRGAVTGFLLMLQDLTIETPRDSAPAYVFDRILSRTGYKELLAREDDPGRAERLDGLRRRFVKAGEGQTEFWGALEVFLDEVFLDTDGKDGSGNRVRLLTAHSSKGLEFPTVFMGELVDGVFPHARSLEDDMVDEERRLAFVGMTRAELRLYLCFHKADRARDGSWVQRIHSRFFEEIERKCMIPAAKREYRPSPLMDRFIEHPSFGRGLVVSQQSIDGAREPYLVINFLDAGRKLVAPDSVALA